MLWNLFEAPTAISSAEKGTVMGKGSGWLLGSTPGIRKPKKRVDPQTQDLVFNPGLARHFVTIGRAPAAQDGFGQPDTTWPVYYECYCEIRMLSGQELYQAEEFTSASQYRFRMRWPGDSVTINVGDRVFFESRAFVIQIVNNVKFRNIIVELTCLAIDGSS